jgi:hypothetical protein
MLGLKVPCLTPMFLTMKSTLSELRILLSNLPKTLGLPSSSKIIYPSVGFELDPELLDQTGDEVGALNEQLWLEKPHNR